jgi:carbohydrate kinase (thermoresistant glucokinase family)
MVVIVMGVAGSGKTTVGSRLAGDLGWAFYDADDFHSDESVRKMASAIPLNDDDRRPWMEGLCALIARCAAQEQDAVMACSALKEAYRGRLSSAGAEVVFVYLKADPRLVRSRMAARRGHYMPLRLVESQFETLEEPKEAIVIPAEGSPAQMVQSIRGKLRI